MKRFGWSKGNPVWLDLEPYAYLPDNFAAQIYAAAWVKEIRRLGYIPGIYARLPFLLLMHKMASGRPDQIWLDDGLHFKKIDHHIDINHIPGLSIHTYPGAVRVWQYGGFKNRGRSFDLNFANCKFARL